MRKILFALIFLMFCGMSLAGGISSSKINVSGLSADEATRLIWLAADNAIANKNYGGAVGILQQIIDDFSDHAMAAKANLWRGYSYHRLGDPNRALSSFETVLNQYPASSWAPEAGLRVAYAKMINAEGVDPENRKVSYDEVTVTLLPGKDIVEETFSSNEALAQWPGVFSLPTITADSTAPSGDSSVLVSQAALGEWECVTGGEGNWSNYRVEASVYFNFVGKGSANWRGICARLNECSPEVRKLYVFVWDGSDGQLRLEKYNGTYADNRYVLGTSMSGITKSGWHTMSIDAIGNQITCYLDGAKVFSVQDAMFPTGKVGLYQMTGKAKKKDLSTAKAALEDLIVRYPDSSQAAEAYLRLGYYYDSRFYETENVNFRALGQEAFAAAFTHPAVIPEVKSDAQLHLAAKKLEYARMGEASYEAALNACKEIVQDEDQHTTNTMATALLMIAEIGQITRNKDLRLSYVNELLDKYPQCRLQVAYALHMLANHHTGEGELEEAIRVYDMIIENFSAKDSFGDGNVVAWAMCKKSYRQRLLGDWEGARQSLCEVLERYPQAAMASACREYLQHIEGVLGMR